MGPKPRIQAEANAESTSGPHDGGPLVYSGLASACILSFGPILYLQLLAHIVFCPSCFASFAGEAEQTVGFLPSLAPR